MKTLVIDKQDVVSNLQAIRARAGNAIIFADLSANGQGMGLIEMAALLHDEGINSFAVSETAAAAALRNGGFEEDSILMLRSTVNPEEISELLELRVILTAGSHEAAAAINGIASGRGYIAEVHVKVDTGLGGYGFPPYEAEKILSIYKYMSNIAVSGIYTRFSDPSNKKRTREQFDTFRSLIEKINAEGFETGIAHAADSVALFKYDFCTLDAICVGSALTGRLPCKGNFGLKRVGYIEAELEEAVWHPAGGKARPAGRKKAGKPIKTAVLPVGWYNGVGLRTERPETSCRTVLGGFGALIKRWAGRKRLTVQIGGEKARILGNIGMCSAVLNVTSANGSTGDMAVLDADPRLVRGLPIIYK